jgi:hypothetical protein
MKSQTSTFAENTAALNYVGGKQFTWEFNKETIKSNREEFKEFNIIQLFVDKNTKVQHN